MGGRCSCTGRYRELGKEASKLLLFSLRLGVDVLEDTARNQIPGPIAGKRMKRKQIWVWRVIPLWTCHHRISWVKVGLSLP